MIGNAALSKSKDNMRLPTKPTRPSSRDRQLQDRLGAYGIEHISLPLRRVMVEARRRRMTALQVKSAIPWESSGAKPGHG